MRNVVQGVVVLGRGLALVGRDHGRRSLRVPNSCDRAFGACTEGRGYSVR